MKRLSIKLQREAAPRARDYSQAAARASAKMAAVATKEAAQVGEYVPNAVEMVGS